MTATAKPKGLHAKIAAVQAAADVSGLEQRNVRVETTTGGAYNYEYITESTLLRVIRPLLIEHGLAVYYSDEIKTLSGNLASVRVSLTVVDPESGEERTMSTEGIGTDKGDKAVNKAKTSALRYLYWKWFLCPSDQDPEETNEPRSDRRPASHTTMATKEEVDAFLEAVKAGGYAVEPQIEKVDRIVQEQEGVPADWLRGQRAELEKAIERDKAKREAAQAAAAEQAAKDAAPEVPQA